MEPDVENVRPLTGRLLTGDFATEEHFIRHDAGKVLTALWPAEVGGSEHAIPASEEGPGLYALPTARARQSWGDD